MDWLKSLLEMTAWTADPPPMYGAFHLSFVAAAVMADMFLAGMLARRPEKDRLRALAVIGRVLAVMEVYKQLFMTLIAGNGQYDLWWFPFQLCSMAMYLGLALPYLRGRSRMDACTFLGTYNLVAALSALAYPEDMLRSYVAMTWHAFLWHALLLLAALIVLRGRLAAPDRSGFGRATGLFWIMAGIAIGLNMLLPAIIHTGQLPDLFYINPYRPSTQPVFQIIGTVCGRNGQIIIYLLALTAASAIVHVLYRHVMACGNDRNFTKQLSRYIHIRK